MTPDAYTNGGRSNDPQRWNRYAYTGGDPVNRLDPTGRGWELTCSGGDGNDDDASCGSGGVMASVSCGSVYVMAAIDGVQMPSPCDFLPVFFAPPPKQPPPCTSQYSSGSLSFIQNNYAAALTVASSDGVPVAWLLAWAAQESGWGTSQQVTANGNYLNQTNTPRNPTGGWNGAIGCPTGAVPGFACFSSFMGSLSSALSTTHQTWSQPGLSALQVMQSMLAANPSVSEASAFQAIANAGFDPVGTSTNAGYGTRVAGTNAAGRINCLQSIGALP
jgi:hypothetical protein